MAYPDSAERKARFLRLAPILLSLAACNQAGIKKPSDPRTTANALSGKVVKIADGDTITVLTGRKKQVKVRFWGIDTPERSQAYGTKAREFTSNLLFGKTVEIETKHTDRYGRTLGVVFANGKDVNLTILEAGMGWWYRQYAKSATDYERAEQRARKKRLGLWDDKNPTPPWDYRRDERKK